MKLIILALVLLVSGQAVACNSFEDCIDKSKGYRAIGDPDYQVARAIAFKLDEISKKLDKSESDLKRYGSTGGSIPFDCAFAGCGQNGTLMIKEN